MALASPLTGNSKQTDVLNFLEGMNILARQDWMKVYDVRRDDVAGLRISTLRFGDDIPVWDGDDSVSKETLSDNTSKQIDYIAYAVSVEIGLLQQKDLPGIVSEVSRKLGQMVAYKYNSLAMTVFTNAFGSETTGDTKALIANDHTGTGGDNRDNNYTATALSRTAVFTAMQMMDDFGSYNGSALDYSGGPLCLVVDPLNRENAIEILSSNLSGADNQANALQAGGFNVDLLVSPHVNQSDWFLQTTQPGAKPLCFWERMSPSFDVLPNDNLSLQLSTSFAVKASPKAEATGIIGSAV